MFWKIVVCGGRDRAFRDWTKQPLDARYPIRILLVDAEGPVSAWGSVAFAPIWSYETRG